MGGTYGAKCHICTHILHQGPQSEPPIQWLTPRSRECADCSFCQEAALSRLIGEVGISVFSPEVRDAVKAFRNHRDHPLIDSLRAEIQAIDVEMAPDPNPFPKFHLFKRSPNKQPSNQETKQ